MLIDNLCCIAIKRKNYSRGKAVTTRNLPVQKTQGGEEVLWYSLPKSEWNNLIKRAPHRIAKMGIWLGLNFGFLFFQKSTLQMVISILSFKNEW
ncbi:MAG: hypothetical protein ACW98I_05060 [Candidatus Hodarchaeales archaeon]